VSSRRRDLREHILEPCGLPLRIHVRIARWTLSASAEQPMPMPMPDDASLVGGAPVHFGTPFSAFMTGTLQAPRVFGIRTGVHF
jgi:hypothetical protein